MNFDDIIYMSLLLFCIGFGHFYRKIDVQLHKKWTGTLIGLFIVMTVSNLHILHTLLTITLGSLIFFFVDARRCHLVSFTVLFSYLLFFRCTFYFGIPTPPGHTNLIQMILTLKLVGLAFEKNNAYTKKRSIDAAGKDNTIKMTDLQPLTPAENEILKLEFIDIIHYSFNYVGVLTGPYYSYKTFRDYWNLPFGDHANCKQATINKIKWVPLYAGLFLLVSYIWPISYAAQPEFFEQRSFIYRLWYVWPSFFIFRMRIYAGLTLSECVCTMAGFGAYPKEVGSRSGGGPSKDYLHYANAPEQLEYDFETIHNIDPYETDTCWTFREAMKSWNMCIQYWLAVNIYKRFPNKKFRTLVTLAVSAYWHGIYSGYYMCMLASPFYLPIEDLYNKLFRAHETGMRRRIIDCIFWVSKFFAFSYMGIAFLLMTMDKIWHYYSSVYHFGYILWILMYVGGLMIAKSKKSKKPQSSTTEPMMTAKKME